jgi:hypothetical protein
MVPRSDGADERERLFFPFHGFTPAYAVGIISPLVLAVAIFARYPRHLAGYWRTWSLP